MVKKDTPKWGSVLKQFNTTLQLNENMITPLLNNHLEPNYSK